MTMAGRATIGTAWILDRGKGCGQGRRRTLDEALGLEIQRLKAFIEKSPVPGVFSAHLEMLEDPMLLDTIRKNISEGMSPAAAVRAAGEEIAGMFSGIDDEYLRTRVDDVRDVCRSLENSLSGTSSNPFEDLPDNAVVVAEELFPSDTAEMDLDKVRAFVTVKGSPSSHTSIIARSRDILTVTGFDISGIHRGDLVLVSEDGPRVLVNPDDGMIESFRSRLADGCIFPEEARQAIKDSGVRIFGNAGSVQDIKAAIAGGADGIGLFRTEFLFMERDTPPSEEEQYQVYREAVEACEGRPLTIRTLDAGADKPVPWLHLPKEDNPSLGMRGIRLSLSMKDMFREQIRAILRAGAHGKVRMMLPMVTRVSEVQEVKELVSESMAELKASGTCFDEDLETGIMVETPAAVLTSGVLACETDFFSIGTNDLTQYVMAAGRDDPSVSYLLDPLDDAVVRAVRMVVESAREAGIPVGVCGEAAADPNVAPMLCGLGADSLSIGSATLIRELKGDGIRR